MTILELHKASAGRSRCSPESLFEADTGKTRILVCLSDVDSVIMKDFRAKAFIEAFPNFLEWNVTKESYTEQELKDRPKQNPPHDHPET